jgi:hypothetical protein
MGAPRRGFFGAVEKKALPSVRAVFDAFDRA